MVAMMKLQRKMPSPNAEQTQLDLNSGGGFFLKGYPSLQAAKEMLEYASISTERTGRKDLKAFNLNSNL